MRIHIGFDLSFSSTGITFYINHNDNEYIEFYRLVRDKNNVPLIPNVNQYKYNSDLYQIELDLFHNINNEYNNGVEYSNKQIELSELCFIVSDNLMRITDMVVSKYRERFEIKNNLIQLYVNFEGSILNGFSFNTQIGLNMLQGIMRHNFIRYNLKQKFNTCKIRVISPTLLKSFFTFDGKADKNLMIKSFINNYDGNKLLPLISLDKKIVESTNDIIDSFALVMFDIYDLTMNDDEKLLFTKIKSKNNSNKKVKRKSIINNITNLDTIKDNLPDNVQLLI